MLLTATAALAQQPAPPPGPPAQQPAPGQYPPPPPDQYQQPAPGQYPPPPTGPYQQPYQNYGPAVMPGYHQHDGFFFRAQIGGGYTSLEQSDADLTIAGGGAAVNLAFGGAVSDRLIIYGEIFDSTASKPTLTVAGTDIGEADGDASVVGVGAGVAYYLPSNTYFSGSLLMQQLTLIDADGDQAGETEFGPGLKLQVGHEWWVSHDWALGLAAQFLAGTMDDTDTDLNGDALKWTATGFSLLFSATYN